MATVRYQSDGKVSWNCPKRVFYTVCVLLLYWSEWKASYLGYTETIDWPNLQL